MKTIGIREARENLRSVLDMAEHEEVVIMIHGKPKARIVGTSGESLAEIAERSAFESVRQRMANPSTQPVPLKKVRARLEAKWKAEKEAKRGTKAKKGRRAAGRR